MRMKKLLRAMFNAAVDAALPKHVIAQNLPQSLKGRTIVVGAGKASAAMTQALEKNWKGTFQASL